MTYEHRQLISQKLPDNYPEDLTLLLGKPSSKAERLDQSRPEVALADFDRLSDFGDEGLGAEGRRGRTVPLHIVLDVLLLVEEVSEDLEDVGRQIPVFLLPFP